MLTTNGGFSFAPAFLACDDSGSASFSADCCLNVVVTSRKITSTMSTSISATMMTAGVVRRLRTRKRMSNEVEGRRLNIEGYDWRSVDLDARAFDSELFLHLFSVYCRRMNSSQSASISTASTSTFLLK